MKEFRPKQAPQCLSCKHLWASGEPENKCFAFPLGIPDEIWRNDFIHTKYYAKDSVYDRGILFEWREE